MIIYLSSCELFSIKKWKSLMDGEDLQLKCTVLHFGLPEEVSALFHLI